MAWCHLKFYLTQYFLLMIQMESNINHKWINMQPTSPFLDGVLSEQNVKVYAWHVFATLLTALRFYCRLDAHYWFSIEILETLAMYLEHSIAVSLKGCLSRLEIKQLQPNSIRGHSSEDRRREIQNWAKRLGI